MKLVQTMSLENPCPRPKSTNRIKRSSVCCVHFCMSNFIINCWWKLELSWDLLTILSCSRRLLSLQWSHLWSSLLLSLYLSSWLQTWCSSFGPDPQILKVASSWGKVIFHRSVPISHWKSQSRREATTCWDFGANWKVTGKLPLVDLFIITNLKMQSWKGWPLCAHMKFLKGRRAVLRELRSDHQKSAQQKQPIMNIEH